MLSRKRFSQPVRPGTRDGRRGAGTPAGAGRPVVVVERPPVEAAAGRLPDAGRPGGGPGRTAGGRGAGPGGRAPPGGGAGRPPPRWAPVGAGAGGLRLGDEAG